MFRGVLRCAIALSFCNPFVVIGISPAPTNAANFAVRKVTDFGDPISGSAAAPLGVLNDQLIFTAVDDGVAGLFRTDGTNVVRNSDPDDGPIIAPSPLPGRNNMPIQIGNELFFNGRSGQEGIELFATDGTSVRMVEDIVPGSFGSDPHNFMEINGRLLFTAYGSNSTSDDKHFTLFTTDGQTIQEHALINDNRATIVPVGNQLLFHGGNQTTGDGGLYVTDGQTIDKIHSHHSAGMIRELDGRAYTVASSYSPVPGMSDLGVFRIESSNVEKVLDLDYEALGDVIGLFPLNGQMNLALFDRPNGELVVYHEDGDAFVESVRQPLNVDTWLYHFPSPYPWNLSNPVFVEDELAYFASSSRGDDSLYAFDGEKFELVVDENSQFDLDFMEIVDGRFFVNPGSRLSDRQLLEIVDGELRLLGPGLDGLTIFEDEVFGFLGNSDQTVQLMQSMNGELLPLGPIFDRETIGRGNFVEFNGELYFRAVQEGNAQLYAIVPVPEPTSLAVIAAGLLMCGVIARRQRRPM